MLTDAYNIEFEEYEEHPDYITVYQPVAGWKAVHLSWDEEDGMYTPWQTGSFAYATKEEAIVDAKGWAEAEEIEFRSS